MRWLVDGYNVIRRDPELRAREAESLESGRRALVHLIARARRALQDEFTVVFDGARIGGATPTAGRIRVVFSRPPSTADDELMKLARQLRSGAVVVSSDRKIQDAARRAGCAVLTAEQFLDALDVPERAPEPGPAGTEAADIKDEPEEETDRGSAAIRADFPRKHAGPNGLSAGCANLDPHARFVENCRVAVMTRHYFIVARDQLSLCEYLTRQFKSEENVEVFLDRRSGGDRRVTETNGESVERRSGDRRHQPFVDTQLRSLGYAMFRVQ